MNLKIIIKLGRVLQSFANANNWRFAMNELLLSLCIPTNGMTKWVIPVVESIFNQGCDDSLFEVVISDNGDNSDLEEKLKKFQKEHDNIRYQKSTSEGFMNQIDVFSAARGVFLKFVNHRTCLRPGALGHFLKFVKDNCRQKPIVYFSNGVLASSGVEEHTSFSEFMCGLSYYASWTTGLGFWKDDFDNMKIDSYDPLHPHMAWLCYYTERDKYIIDNNILLCEITTAHTEKGSYNLFKAFAVDYVAILEELYTSKKISEECFKYCKDDLENFLVTYYKEFIVCKEPCSYDLTDYISYINVYYDINTINSKALDIFRQNYVIRKWDKILDKTKELFGEIKKEAETKNIYIYGAGSGGKKVYKFLSDWGVGISAFVDKNAHNIKTCCGLPVLPTSEIDSSGYYIVSVMGNFGSIEKYTEKLGLNDDNSCIFFREMVGM